jgi:hypothetical protein
MKHSNTINWKEIFIKIVRLWGSIFALAIKVYDS